MIQHLSVEFQAVVRERQSFLDRALGQLQYQQELNRLQLLHIRVLTSGHGTGASGHEEICAPISDGGIRKKLPKKSCGTVANQAWN